MRGQESIRLVKYESGTNENEKIKKKMPQNVHE